MQAEADNIPVIFHKFKERACTIRDNETKPDTENASI